LLPESNGKTSAVNVTTSAGEALLSVPYQTAAVGQVGDLKLGATTADEVRVQYPQLLDLKSLPEQRFTLYFMEGGSKLTAESEAQLPVVIARASERAGGEILVIGHTDRVGSVDANDALSLKRAASIKALLVARSFKAELIEAIGRGEREPLIQTADEVSESRNRRAEIVVR
jgi:outer membrane protein OmpA-like peptidoglycan-associated protein